VKIASLLPPSPSTTTTSPIASVGGASSSRIVPKPCPSRSVAWLGFVRFTRNVSFGSSKRSPRTPTVIVLVVWPGAKLTTPLAPA